MCVCVCVCGFRINNYCKMAFSRDFCAKLGGREEGRGRGRMSKLKSVRKCSRANGGRGGGGGGRKNKKQKFNNNNNWRENNTLEDKREERSARFARHRPAEVFVLFFPSKTLHSSNIVVNVTRKSNSALRQSMKTHTNTHIHTNARMKTNTHTQIQT